MSNFSRLLLLFVFSGSSLAFGQAQSAAQPSTWEMLVMPAGFLAIMYFFMIRPQQKRAKEHKEFLTALKPGDEVITTGGMIGRIKTVQDKFVSVEIAANTIVKIIKSEVTASGIKNQPTAPEKA